MRSVKSQKVTHSHIPRTIVVKLFNKISLVHVTAAAILPFRILFRSFGIQFLPTGPFQGGGGGAGLEVHVQTGTPATSVLRQRYVAQSPILVLRALWIREGVGVLITGYACPVRAPVVLCPPCDYLSLVTKAERLLKTHSQALLRHMALLNYD